MMGAKTQTQFYDSLDWLYGGSGLSATDLKAAA